MRLKKRTKQLLDKLQTKLVLAGGRKLTHQIILEAIVDFACEHEEELLQRLAGIQLPLPRDEVEALMKLPMDWGVETREEDIDRHLYGEGKQGK